MSAPRILSIGRAVPAQSYTQRELFAYSPWEPTPLLEALFFNSPVQSRALFIPPDWYGARRSLTDTNGAWREGAMGLASQALAEAAALAGVTPAALDLIAVTTVTGYSTPGLDLLLAQRLGLRETVGRVHFNCIGCHAAIPLLRVAADHVARRPEQLAAAVAVEVCSACFARDPDPQNLVALSLFGDGAAVAMVGTHGEGPELVDFGSLFAFDHIEALGFDLTAEGFRIVLDPSIPGLIASRIEEAVEELLRRHGLGVQAIGTWCFHPGGSRILDAVQDTLKLSDAHLRASRRVLRSHGNMSSPSVLFVLAETLRASTPPRGSWGVMAAFGPGLGIEVALLRF